MRDKTSSTQIYTLFGGAYVPEDHGRGPALEEPKKRAQGRWAIALIALFFGATTATVAMTATSRNCSPPRIFSNQSPANFQMKIPGGVWFEDAVY